MLFPLSLPANDRSKRHDKIAMFQFANASFSLFENNFVG